MAPRLVLTGASGYIGTRLVERALGLGCEVVVLGSPPAWTKVTAVPWRLAETVPGNVLKGSTAVIHLGHSWASDADQATAERNLNLNGALQLASQVLEARGPRFVFASTTSARPDALNAYGRIKYAIEQRLHGLTDSSERLSIARIGLVYGGPDRGQYGLISKLVALTPVLPMIGLNRQLQPIHLDEVCDGLLKLALDPPQGSKSLVLAGRPMTFGDWLRTLKRCRVGKGLVLVPVPMALAILACDATSLVPFIPTISRERVLGLAGATPMDSTVDLKSLGLQLRDPPLALSETRAARRRRLAESAAFLAYVTGQRRQSRGAIVRLARVLGRDPASRTALPWFALRWPGLLRLLEPIMPSMQHGLCRRLHLAAMVAEAENIDCVKPRVASMAVQMIAEITAAPFRLLLARIYA
jgi:nucleoside-diphosphate-sugar epimerase